MSIYHIRYNIGLKEFDWDSAKEIANTIFGRIRVLHCVQGSCRYIGYTIVKRYFDMYKVGYTQGVFDMFHIGHLNLINRAKEQCEVLIVGVNADELVKKYKFKTPVVNEFERAEIIQNLKSVDKCVIVSTLDKVELYKEYKFDAIFIGDDWKNDARWKRTEVELAKYNVPVIFLPYTKDISSTKMRGEISNRVE